MKRWIMRRKLVDKERLGYLVNIYTLLCLLLKYALHEQAVSMVSSLRKSLEHVRSSRRLYTAVHDITV